jgi:hypothetical protein
MSGERSTTERERLIAELEKIILAQTHDWLYVWREEDSKCLYELPFDHFAYGVLSGLRILAKANQCATSAALLQNIINFMLNDKGDSPS